LQGSLQQNGSNKKWFRENGSRHLIAATQLTSVFCRRLGGTPMVGDFLAVEVLDARDRG
jgi:hypothetical protein